MNKVILIGRLVRDAEVRYSQGENATVSAAIASFTMAVDRTYKRQGDATADFINCKAFGKNAEFFEKYGQKGVKFAITGHIQTGSYTNKDGNKVYTTDVIIDTQEFCESKASNGGQTVRQEQTTDADGFVNIPDGIEDELPFA